MFNEYIVKDSFICKEVVNSDLLMAIIGITSLFTNIPFEETINI